MSTLQGNRLETSLVRALFFILQKNEGIRVFDYARAEDFTRLWRFDDVGAKRILVVWSETALDPDLSPINASDCLSPVDWAVCYAAQGLNAPEALPDVLILDLDPSTHDRLPSVARLNALKSDQLPWLRLEQDVQLGGIIQWLTSSSAGDRDRCTVGLMSFVRDMRLNLMQPRSDGGYDRHAVANIIGPMILRGQAARPTLHSTALLRLLSVCNLAPSEGFKADSASDSLGTETGAGLGILLMDDQAAHGWADWARDVLPEAHLSVLTDPTSLVKEVERQIRESAAKDCRFRLSLPGLPAESTPILLLDLMLFSGNSRKELGFYRDTLLPFIREHFLDRADLAWPSFCSSHEAFRNAVRAIDDGSLLAESKGKEHREVLSWLPRALALVDMSLPILLFSSTGRREVISLFAEYGNIITSFVKPRFAELCDGVASEPLARRYVADLYAALNVARLHVAPRSFESDIVGSALQGRTVTVGGVSEAPAPASDWSVTVHIDESGTWNGNPGSLKLGALVSVIPNAKSEWDIDATLSRAHQGARTQKTYCRDSQHLAGIVGMAQQQGAILGYIELNASDEMIFAGTDAADEFHDEWVVDNLWRQMFVRLVECSVFGVARWLLPSGGRLATMSVRAPTRGLPLDVGLDHLKDEHLEKRLAQRRANLFNKWGVETVHVGPKAPLWSVIEDLEHCRCDGEPKQLWDLAVAGIRYFKPATPPPRLVRVFNYADPRPIVESVSQWYRHTGAVPRSQLVCAFNLNSHGAERSKYIPVLHFAVDGLLSARELPNGLRRWSVDYGPTLDRLLRANRFLMGNDVAAATLAMKEAHALGTDGMGDIFTSLAEDLTSQITGMAGTEHLRIVDGWPRAAPARSAVQRLEGRVSRAVGEGQRHKTIMGADGRDYFAPNCPVGVGSQVAFRLSNRRGVIFPGESILVTDVQARA